MPEKVVKLQRIYLEKVAISKKKKLYKSVKWTKVQQREFDDYWKSNYGKKIPNKWHKLYEALNGIHNIYYFPEYLYTTKLELIKNDFYYAKVYEDKGLNDIIFNNRIKNVRTPKTFIVNNEGNFYDGERKMISQREAIKRVSSIGEAVIKPTVGSCSGKNVKIINFIEGVNERDGKTVAQILGQYKKNFIIQERIQAHEELKILYPHAINTFRVTTYVIDEQIDVAPVVLRIGANGGEVDNIHAGGMGIAVSNDGTFNPCAYKLGYGNVAAKYEKHPDTKVLFAGYKVSFVKEIINAAMHLHEFVNRVGIISWDFTVNSDNEIILIEANYEDQGIWLPQILSGKAMFGENTTKILQYLRSQ